MPVSWLLVAALSGTGAYADLPLHCLPEDVVGDWVLVSDNAPAESLQGCGHSSPNSVEAMLSLVGEGARSRLVRREERLEVTLTDRVEEGRDGRRLVAIGPSGQRGEWTTVADEGFEVRLGNRSYFAHFEFEVLPGQEAAAAARAGRGANLDEVGAFFGQSSGHRLTPPGSIFGSHCERTSVGWHSRPAGQGLPGARRHGCFFAWRRGAASSAAAPTALVALVTNARGTARRVLRLTAVDHRSSLRDASAPKVPGPQAVSVDGPHSASPPLPSTWDWREQPELQQQGDDLGADFDQGVCGSCYAHATSLALAARFRIALARRHGHNASMELSWRAAVRCSPFTEGCRGGYPFLVGRLAAERGLLLSLPATDHRSVQASRRGLRLAKAVLAPPLCEADVETERIDGQCPSTCSDPGHSSQPVYFAESYGYVGGFAQGASEEAIMRELLDHGPLILELSVRAIPDITRGNSGEVVTSFNNGRTHHDSVETRELPRLPSSTASNRSSAELESGAGEPFRFREWVWADHALLTVGWGEAPRARPGVKPGLGSREAQIILGTPLQIALLQRRNPRVIKFWSIRNSWGRAWGQGGYGKLIRGENAGGAELSAVWVRPDLNRLPAPRSEGGPQA